MSTPPREPPGPGGGPAWSWDPSLYAGSAAHYALGRVPYPPELAGELARALPLDGSGVLLDVGCGPGSLTLLLAPHVALAVGVDADEAMLAEAARLAAQQGVRNVRWRHLRAEDLPADLPAPRLVTFAQSFHWVDRPRVAAAVRAALVPGGALVHVSATTHEGVDSRDEGGPGAGGPGAPAHPRPPRRAVDALVRRHLGPRRRAGRGVLTSGTPGGEDEVYRAAGFSGPQRLHLPGREVERSAEQVAASVYSLSSSAPHLFGERLGAFDRELRALLAAAAPRGRFTERVGPVVLSIWR
ncbi:class I SAM-dependent methyltransferase [Kineococcus indalonis]|uniref:class I SAM-dependent methyltransferase n=1 Tax=Kineococcus indalonis TaxID=2696566 RepID=UPI0014137193|nr:class I SAM-dependent methyltransferase [Kineococcus indalonis]NAZ86067.1 methyltransferase domain-containing protein [Kineococcus indalonis]